MVPKSRGHPENGRIPLLIRSHNFPPGESSPPSMQCGNYVESGACVYVCVPVGPGMHSTCQLTGTAGFVPTPEHNVKLAPPASALHRRSLFNSDNQNIGRLEILVIWFSLVPSWGMNAFEELVKKIWTSDAETLPGLWSHPSANVNPSSLRPQVWC